MRFRQLVAGITITMNACTLSPAADDETTNPEVTAIRNPVLYFEIPVVDLDRAIAFYEDVLALRLSRQTVDGYEMAFFPRDDGKPGASGALAKGDVYRPSRDGALIYFDVADIDAVLRRVTALGSEVLYEKKDIGEAGYVAEFEDSEGNRIALTQARE
ncbi:MAG: VOC family protein [Pseudomonadota bacterium]